MTECSTVIRVGSRVCVRDEDGDAEFQIVDPAEADAVRERVSADSPIGRALLGRHVGDLVRFRAPVGVLAVKVLEIG
ncbi:MAG TPA: GreA/GreB family elongation factor [Terriglobales bacterium]|nr:GreA/GreB family elongation factor [Terriglobales bacterium]